MEKINRFSLHLINVVQYKRLDSGKSAYQFSLDLKKSRNYVSQIEHVNEDGQYNSADYPLIAAELECEYPIFFHRMTRKSVTRMRK